MRVLRFVPMFIVFVLVVVTQSILTSDQIYAGCCNIYKPPCTSWSGLVYGSAEMLGTVGPSGMFRIKDNNGFFKDFKASQDVIDEFKNEGISIDYGFSILKHVNGELTLIAFVPANRDHKPTVSDKTGENAVQIVKFYNKLFEDNAQKPTSGM